MRVKRLGTNLFGAEIPGGNYTAEEFLLNGVRFMKIKDVPIFCNVPKGERGNKKDIAKEWHLAALAKAQAREEKDRYLPPLHFHHHSWGDEARAAGFFRLTRVGEITYESKVIDSSFADLLVPMDKFSMIETFQFPYRSVEVFDWDIPEINSLALLDHEVPFFRLELLTIGEKVKATDSRELVFKAYQKQPVQNVVGAGLGGVATFSFKKTVIKLAEAPVADPKDEKKKKEVPPAAGGEAEEVDGGDEDDAKSVPCETCKGDGLDEAGAFCPTCKGTGESADPNKPADGQTPADMGETDMKALLQSLLQTNQQILAKLGELGTAPTVDPAAPPAEPKDPEGAKMAAETKEALKAMAAATAEAVAARKEIASFRADSKADQLVKAKLDGELRGKNLDADDKAKLLKFAKLGEEYLNEFAAVLAKRLPDDPHGIDDDAAGSGTVPGTTGAAELMNVECLKKYSHDPGLFAEAQGYYKEALELAKKGFDRDPARHIDVQMRFKRGEIGAGKMY